MKINNLKPGEKEKKEPPASKPNIKPDKMNTIAIRILNIPIFSFLILFVPR